MATVNQPTGMKPLGRVGNEPYNGAITSYPLTTNNTVTIAVGDAVGLVAGSVVPQTATPVSGTLSANTPIGVVTGFNYIDLQGRFQCTQLLPANAVTAGYTKIVVLVVDDNEGRFVIQANGTVPASDLGACIALGGFTDDTTMKISRVYADIATISQTTNTLALKIVGFDKTVGNIPGDTFTVLVVKWNTAVHYWSVANAH